MRFSLFNKMNLEEFLVEDQQHDTLLFAKKIQVSITDWFFFKKQAELKYIGLENAVINLKKTDTLWNYQFLINYFAPTSTSTKKKGGIEFNLKKVSLKNVAIRQKDEWRGEDMFVSLGNLEMDAKDLNLSGKNFNINSLDITQPYFSITNYPGKRTSGPKKDTVVIEPKAAIDSLLKWNRAGWTMNIASLKINNGTFKQVKKTDPPIPSSSPFDAKNIEFSVINGQFTNVKFEKDTFSAKAALSTKERSGFVVKSLNSDIKIHPQGMHFDNLDLRTNNSVIRNSFAMNYEDMGDMSDFLNKVRMSGTFDNAEIDHDDLAYFAPAAKNWPDKIKINGTIRGAVTDLTGRGLVISAGNTYINGDLTLTGLPGINQTFIDFKSNDSRTNYYDLVKFIPSIKNVQKPDLVALGNVHFKGSFTGFIRDFVTFGTIRTNLGTITSDLNMKLPPGKEAIYSGNIATDNFRLGTFIRSSQLGLISFSGVVKGHGLDIKTLGVDLKANVREIDFKGYRYSNIVANGKFDKEVFDGYFSAADPNLKVTLNGLIDLNGDQSQFDLVADVQQANLQALGFTRDDIKFNGLFNLNFTGNNIDNFFGSARISQANLVRNNQRLSFDSLSLTSDYLNGTRTLTAKSNEFEGTVTGDYHIADLPDAIQLFLHNYYPAYIKPPRHNITDQNFKFNILTREVDQLVQVIHPSLKGFNDSKIEGSLDLAQNQLELTAMVPQFQYNNYVFSNTNITGKGDLNQLNLQGDIDNVAINDSISLPNTTFSLIARQDSSDIRISTAANQAVTKADLRAQVITYTDGVKINFDTSSFVLNSKTWTIDKGGELSFRQNTPASGEVVLRESNQEIKLRTEPSSEGSGNDLLVDLTKVNIGDIAPYFVPKWRMDGLISGSAKLENPGDKMIATGDFKTQYFWLNNDSLGELNISKIEYDNRTGNFKTHVTNNDPQHSIDANVNIFLKGNHSDNLIAIETKDYQLNILETFLGNLFADIQGYATGKLDIKGELSSLNYVGKAKLRDAGLKVKFTQVFYKLRDTEIELREHEIDFGTLKLYDTVTKNTATFAGSIQHDSWKNMFFDLEARVDGKPITLLNTTAVDNSSFYGHAIGTGSMILVGPQTDMALVVNARASEQDSSHIVIPPAKTRSSGMAEFLIERTHGRSMQDTLAVAQTNKITFDIDLTADPHTTIEVILDEVTGDVIRGKGRGTLNIHSGTTEPLTINGNYFLEQGSYLFSFQSFFKRPFELRQGGNNYIKWTGDPNKATISFDAQYTAKEVSFAPLMSTSRAIRDDVFVIVKMSGELFQPKFDFKLEFPPSSIATSDPVLAFNLNQIENNPNEINKQVTYLIVFNSFAPLETQGGATAASAGTIGSALNELAYSTISSLFFNEINRQFSSILAKIFKDDKLKVNISGSVYNRNLVTQNSNNSFDINSSNVNITVSRAVFNDRLIITAGSTLDIPLQTTLQQQFQFLPDVTMQWLMNPSGTIRATFFYRQNLDFLNSPTNSNEVGRNRKIGGSLSFRKEVNRLGDLFKRKNPKKKKEEPQNGSNQSTSSTPIQKVEEN